MITETIEQPTCSPSNDAACSMARRIAGRIQMRILGDAFNGRETTEEDIAGILDDELKWFARNLRECLTVKHDLRCSNGMFHSNVVRQLLVEIDGQSVERSA